jgi:hypothetical protein
MIIGFPTMMQEFEVRQFVPRYAEIHYAHIIGRQIEIHVPIDLKPADYIWVDLHNSQVHVIERAGIVIWRSGWLN